MKRRILRLLLAPLLLGAPMPASSNAQPTVELAARPLQPAPDEGSARASGGEGRIAVQGALPTPTPCYTLSGEARREDAVITLTVQARANEGGCIQMIAGFAYDATVRGVPAGRYTLRVVHAYAGTGWDTQQVLEHPVEVR
jgi:hypothetical protein